MFVARYTRASGRDLRAPTDVVTRPRDAAAGPQGGGAGGAGAAPGAAARGLAVH